MQVCIIPGDGIGPEVIGAARRVLLALVPDVELVEAEAGWEAFQRHGVALPAATLAAARASDAVLFGAVASPSHPVPGYRSPIVQLRRELDLYANIRPVTLGAETSRVSHRRSLDRVSTKDQRQTTRAGGGLVIGRSSLVQATTEFDNPGIVVVRENTEGLYAGRERLEDGGDTAIAERVITRRASARIARAAFELARSRRGAGQTGEASKTAQIYPPRAPRVTIAHKANVLRVSDGLFREAALSVAQDFPDVAVEEMLVDVAAMRLAQSPERFDVLVTTNMFGDILSDVACIHGGGLGLATSANLGEAHALFEPVHGAAPDIAGMGVANPLAAIGCVALLLDHRNRQSAAARLRAAVAAVLRDGPRTPDLGGDSTTAQVTDAVLSVLSADEGDRHDRELP